MHNIECMSCMNFSSEALRPWLFPGFVHMDIHKFVYRSLNTRLSFYCEPTIIKKQISLCGSTAVIEHYYSIVVMKSDRTTRNHAYHFHKNIETDIR